jgi:octaprenyl-diphosphate synthase
MGHPANSSDALGLTGQANGEQSRKSAVDPSDNRVIPSAKERFSRALSLVPELAQVEETIRSAFQSDVPLMHEIPEYLLSLGGKRIRPVLALLCGKALGIAKVTQPLNDVSAGIELIHMATLLHDDIIDHSPTRRHQPSPLAKFGVNGTLLSGDFLLTRAFGLCAKLDQPIIAATECACIQLVEGEALETLLCDEVHSLDSSLTIAKRKTASLFRLAAFCAAHIAGTPATVKEAMSRFGEDLGVAFQIIDDILDVTSDEETLGKRPGLDIIERKPSIVNVLWLASGDAAAAHLLTPLASTPNTRAEEEVFVQAALASLQNGAVIAKAKQLAFDRSESARAALKQAISRIDSPDRTAVEALGAVIDFAVERVQ